MMWIDIGHSRVNMDYVTHVHIRAGESVEIQLSHNTNPDVKGDHDRLTLIKSNENTELFDKVCKQITALPQAPMPEAD